MEDYILTIIYFIVVFILVFCGDYFFIKKPVYNSILGIKKKSKKAKKVKKEKKQKDIFELSYITVKFKLDSKKLALKKCILDFALINAFIISFTVTILSMLDLFIAWQFLIGFALLMGLIYSLYELYGKYCVKKGWTK